MEIVNYDTWDNPFTMFQIMGFGKQDPSQSLLLSPGLHVARLGTGAAPGRVGHRAAARRGAGDATRSSAPTRTSRSRPARSRRGRSPACASRSSAWPAARSASSSSTSPVSATTTPRSGRRGSGYRVLVEGEPHLQDRARARLRPRRPQPRRLPRHRHARRQRHPPRGAGRPRRPHHARPPRLLRGCLTLAVHRSGAGRRRRPERDTLRMAGTSAQRGAAASGRLHRSGRPMSRLGCSMPPSTSITLPVM